MSRKRFAVIFALVNSIGVADAFAVEPAPFGFALNLERFNSSLSIEHNNVDTTTETVGIVLWEPAQPDLVLGLTLGQAFVTQSHYPTSAGLDLSGFFGELSIARTFADFGGGSIFGETSYRYMQTADDTNTNEFHSHTVTFTAGARVEVASIVAFRLAGSWSAVSGTEKVAVPAPRHNDVSETTHAGGSIGIELNVDRGGYVGLQTNLGSRQGLSLYFSRRY